jgi:GNAT superfamily N-acetyltransferase
VTPSADSATVNGRYSISTDPARLDREAIHAYLTTSYWARGRTLGDVLRSIRHSLSFGLYDGEIQIGFARVVTDYVAHAHLCDVYVVDAYQGQGLGTWLIHTVLQYPELQSIRRWTLATSDAHDFYARFGFGPIGNPDKYMELLRTTQS